MDRWFAEGTGVVQEVSEHHGTYQEGRRLLVRSTIQGKTHSYQLTPAETVPLSESDCQGAGWRHYLRADGAAFRTMKECAGYFRPAVSQKLAMSPARMALAIRQ